MEGYISIREPSYKWGAPERSHPMLRNRVIPVKSQVKRMIRKGVRCDVQPAVRNVYTGGRCR